MSRLARPKDILKCLEQQPETEVLNKILLGLPIKERAFKTNQSLQGLGTIFLEVSMHI